MTYTPVHPDWDHQARARAKAWLKKFFAYLMEMGTGKTKVTIDEFLEMYTMDLVRIVVIFAPKGVYMNWVRNELPEHIPESMRDEVQICVWASGGGSAANRARLRTMLEPSPLLKVFVVNLEAFSSGKGQAEQYIMDLIGDQWEQAYGAIDESTFIKNPTAARTKAMMRLREFFNYRRELSGLPVPRGPLDMWSQAEWLRAGLLGQSFWAYQARYAVLKEQRFGGRRVKVVVGYRNIEELTERIEPWSFRVTKDECLDLPPKIYTTREVELTDEQVRIYAEIRDFAIAEMGGEGSVTATSVITQILRMQQVVCGHTKSDDGALLSVPSNRLSTLMEVISEVDGKVIVWNRFRPDVHEITAALRTEYGDESVAEFHGGNTETRHLDSHRFQNDERCRFMVASYAGGHGNTWTAASTVVYFSNDYDLEKRAQSEDRAHRGGQTKHVTYVDLVARGTVDEKIIKALREKISLASSITGDNYREWLI